ncbi:MAG: hypothetical protein Q4B85_10555, partial [Lachnospiraceae bacterium]|nr:hypothetical protein [Lachnospiraceae bacterium]
MELNGEKKGASEYTKKVHRRLLENLNTEYEKTEEEDISEVRNHLIYSLGNEDISDSRGNVVMRRSVQH